VGLEDEEIILFRFAHYQIDTHNIAIAWLQNEIRDRKISSM